MLTTLYHRCCFGLVALAICLTACFDPTVVEGVPCGLDTNNPCPGNMICDPVDNRCRLEPTGEIDAGQKDAATSDANNTDSGPITAAELSLTPNEADFGAVVESNTSAMITFTVTNSGDGSSTTLTATITGSSQFHIPSDACSGAILAPNESCKIETRFSPTEAGNPTAELHVTRDGGDDLVAALSGQGLALGALQMSPTDHDFGAQKLGGATAAQIFTVTNTGESTSGVPTTTLSDTTNFSISSSTCTEALAANATCTVSVAFSPDAVGSHVASLSVEASPGGAAVGSLGGTGTASVQVTATGTGSGTVVSAPAGINCGGTCTANFSVLNVSLSQTPTGASVFRGWSGACSGLGNCELTMNNDQAVVALWDACAADEFLRCDAGNVAVRCNSAGTGETSTVCPFGCNATTGSCNECVPNTGTCSGGVAERCNADGTIADDETCALGCLNTERCADVDPSNDLASHLEMSPSGPDLVLSDGATISTTTGTVTNGDATVVTVPFEILAAPASGVGVLVLMVKSLRTTGTVTLSGNNALAVVSDGDIVIGGELDLGTSGAMIDDGTGCAGEPGLADETMGGSGGGGGGFGSQGGAGGSLLPSSPGLRGGLGGDASGNLSLTPLRGGCSGGGCTGGNCVPNAPLGGGALQLVSRQRIEVTSSGAINANGGGGGTYVATLPGNIEVRAGSGGASGGGVLLEAPVVDIAAGGGVAANGGGGGCQDGPGARGLLGTGPALGAMCNPNPPNRDGSGGNGASYLDSSTDGENVTQNSTGVGPSGGGGGGGRGRIRINSYLDQYNNSGYVSPGASAAAIGRR